MSKKRQIIYILQLIWVFILIAVSLWAMDLCPIWNGVIPNHRDQYEKIAEALLKGQLHFDYDVEEDLLNMDNPYDPDEREKIGVDVHWDHAYYNGHYYMYFGIVPVLMLFIPFRVLFGRPLLTFHATQFYTAFIILGFFFLLRFLKDKFYPKMNECLLTALITAFSLASVWYFVEAPALYCTAISSAVCMMIWSLFFYFSAVFTNITLNRKILLAAAGALCGALCFGCRPTVAAANFVAVPLFIIFLAKNKIPSKEKYKLIFIFLPYIIIGIALMLYNYARFDNPFEFGQSYQMTFYDQKDISSLSNLNLKNLVKGLGAIFFDCQKPSSEFPYIKFGGIFFEFPIFLIGFPLGLLFEPVRAQLKKNKLFYVYLSTVAVLFVIAVLEIVMSPIILERYHADFYFLMGIQTFIIIGSICQRVKRTSNKLLTLVFIILSVTTSVRAILLFFVPNDLNYTQYYGQFLDELRLKINQILPF